METANADPSDPYGHFLNRIAGQGLRIAARLEDRVMTAETGEEEARAALAWTKVARGVRQTLALDSKLARERQSYRRDFGPQMERDRAKLVSQRRTQVHNEINKLIWTEYGDDAEHCDWLTGELFELLDTEVQRDAFLDEPADIQIDRIRHILGLDAYGRGLADEEAAGPPAEAADDAALSEGAADPEPAPAPAAPVPADRDAPWAPQFPRAPAPDTG